MQIYRQKNKTIWWDIISPLIKSHLILAYLNYYLSFDVYPSVWVSVFLQKKFFSSKMDQIRKFGEQTSRILELKPEGLEG